MTCTDVEILGGKCYVRWSDGVELEFASIQDAKDYVQNTAKIQDVLRSMGIAKFFQVSPDGSNPSVIEGHSITLDLTQAVNIVKLS